MMDKDITDPSFKYAPSQNPIDPLKTSGSAALPNTMAQQVDFVPSGDDFADTIAKQTRQRIADQTNAMNLAISKAAAGNADEAAAAQRLGYETGVGADIAARNMKLLEQRLATDRLAQLDLFRRDPVLARMLANKDFAAVAHDDLPNLMESGEQINPDLSLFEEFLRGRGQGYKTTERGVTGADMLAASYSGVPIPESLRAKAAQQSQEMADLRASGGFAESFGVLEGNIESMIPKQAEMALYGAVAGGLILGAPTGGIGMVPGMVAGAGMGLTSAGIVQSFQLEGGNLFIDMLDDGIPEETARVAAPIGGAIIAALEMIPLKFVTGEAKKLIKREVAGQVIDTLKQTGMLDVTKRFLQSYGIGVTTEVGTELAQDAVGMYVQEIAMLATDPLYEEKWKSEKGRAELAKQFVETFIEVGQGMAIMGAFLPGANFIGDARRARKAKATRQFFKDIDKNASESKLKGRNPRSYQEWFEEKARGTANHTLFIDIEKLREAMVKNNVSVEQLETILPGVTKAIADAKGMNGIDFAFPTSVYAARLSDLAFGQALQEHMRFDPNDMSIAENNQYVKERERIVEEMKESAMELMKADAAIEQSAQAVTDLVTAQLVAAGKYTESEARSMASVASASATVMSARFNMTPLDWHNKYGAKVFGEGQVAPAAAQQVAPTITESEKLLTNEDRQELSDLEKEMTEANGGSLSDRQKSAIKDRKFELSSRRNLEQNHPEIMKLLLEENAGSESDIAKLSKLLVNSMGAAAANVATAFDKGLISELELAVIIKRLEAVTDKESAAEFRKWAFSHKNKEIGKAFGELPMSDEMNRHPKAATQFVAKLIPETIAQNKLDKEARAKAKAEKAAVPAAPLEQASRIDADYMAAVERGDMETAQRMVDEAAKLSMPNSKLVQSEMVGLSTELVNPSAPLKVVFHGGRPGTTTFDQQVREKSAYAGKLGSKNLHSQGIWLAPVKGNGSMADFDADTYASNYQGGVVYSLYANITNPARVFDSQIASDNITVESLKAQGYDGAFLQESGVFVAFDANQVKSADPITRDAAGNVIPLSRRFNIASTSILEQAATVSAITYSALDRAVSEVTAKSLAASGWKEQIKGWVNKGIVKQSEVEWSGLVEYLDMQEGKITKETVSEFLKNNGVKVETVTLGDRRDMVKIAAIKGAYAAEAALGDIYGLGGTWQSQFETYRNLVRTDAPRNQIAEAAVPIDKLLENEFGTDLDEYIGDAYESGGSDAKYSRYVLPGAKNYREVLVKLPVGFMPPAPALSKEGLAARQVVFDKYAPQLEALEQEISNLTYESTGTDAEAQRLADAGNEREALETQRDAEANALYRIPNAPQVKPFISSHWDESNVLVHLRMNDRTDADGKRVLFVEEVQSDYGQEGKKKGFVSPVTQEDIDKEEKLRNETREASRNVALARSATAMEQRRILLTLGVKSYADIISAGERRKELTDAYNKLVIDDKEFAIAKEKEVLAIAEEIRVNTKYNEAFEATRQNNRPFRAPFVETTDGWLNLGLKHVMLEAINGGYDRVAFVDGDQSVTRYKDALTEAVDEIEIRRNDDGTYTYNANKAGGTIQREASVSAKRIGEVFGKAGSKQLLEQADANPNEIYTISSEDIQIGGEGMRKFYDDVLPAALNKLLKKYGGEKLQQIEIDTRVPEDNSYYNTLIDNDIIRQRGFDVTSTMKEKVGQGLPLFQAMPSGPPRATIDLSTFFITLNTAADLTSYLHEMAHFYMATYVNIANEPGAPPQITADLQIIFDWLGIKDLAAWNAMTMEEQRKYWEAFGYNHEIYLWEGKSPSVEMQGVFDRFSAWLRKIYKNIRDELNVIYRREFGEDLPMLTPEIRGVMDRMLATEKQIKYAESVNNMTPLFLTQEQSGYDDARWAAYQAMVQEAHDQSVTDLTKASLRQMEWLSNARTRLLKEMQAKHDDIRDKMRSDIADEVAAEPVYMAMSVLKTGKGRVANGEMVVFSDKYKLNLAIVKKMIPAENLSKLGYGKFGMLSEDGLHPDMVAEMFGFKSGDELVLALLAAKPVKEEVDSRLDARMLAEYGDMNTPAEMEVQVQKALHNEARERFIGVEARFVASATRPVRAMTDAARLAANTIVNAQKIENIRPSNYAAAEARAARDAADAYKQRQSPEQARKTSYTRSYNEQIAAGVDEATAVAEATKKGDQAAAAAKDRQDAFAAKYGNREPAQVVIRAKQAQVVQNQLVKVSTAALEEVDTAVKDFRKFFGSDEKIAKSRNMDLVDAARAILSYYGFGKVDKNPADYIKKLEAYNPELYAEIEPLISQASTGVRDYTQMTMDDFRMLRDVVDALWAQSRRDKQITVAGKKIALDGVLSELDARLNEIGVPTTVPGEKSALTTKEKFAAHLYSAKALLRRVENWADATDGAGGVGAFTKYIYRPVKDAVNAYRVDRNNYVKRFVDLVGTLDLPVGKITSPELDYTFGVGNGGIGKAELLGAMLHTGNESNYKKLLIGRKWGEFNADESVNTSRWDAFVGRMITEGVLTKEDFDFLQAVWDLNEEIKPIAQRAHRDLYGYYFKEVEATSFTNRFGTYRGGYVPAKTDAAIVRDAQRQAKAEELEADFRSSMPSTGMGFTKGRVEYNKPLSLDVRLMAKHIDDVLRFAHIQPAVKDVLRIVNNRAFADKLSSIDPTAVEFMLLPWLNRTARQSTNEPGRNKAIDNFWRTLRSRTGMSIMFANLRNALQQVTGLFPSALKVSKGALKDSLFAYLASPRKTADAIAGLSPFMNERMHSQIFEIQDQMNDLLLNPSKFDNIQKWSQHHGYFLQSAFQNFVDIVTWNGKYNQVLSEIGTTLSYSEAQTEAIQQADAAVRSTQGSMSAEDVAAFEVGSPFYKTFVQFTGYFNMLANLNTDEYVKVLRDLGWRGNKGKLVSIYMLGFLAPTLVADAIARSLGAGWDDDDDGYLDDVADWFFGSQVRAGAAMVPFGSAAYTAFAAGFTARTYDDRITSSPSIGSLEASTVGVGKAVVNLASDDKELTGRNVRDVLTLITNATGVPVSVLGRPIGYQMEVNRGKVEPTDPIDYMRGLITGVPSAESKKK